MAIFNVRNSNEVPAPPTIVLSRKAQLWAAFQGFDISQLRGVRDSYKTYVQENSWFRYYRTDEVELIKSALTLALHGEKPLIPKRK